MQYIKERFVNPPPCQAHHSVEGNPLANPALLKPPVLALRESKQFNIKYSGAALPALPTFLSTYSTNQKGYEIFR